MIANALYEQTGEQTEIQARQIILHERKHTREILNY